MSWDKLLPLEHDEQVTFIQWCDSHKVLVFAIPNGSNKSKVAQGRFKAEGLRAGIPDLMIPIARKPYNGLFIEMKRRAKSSTSKAQKEWIIVLKQQGYSAEIAKGCDEAIRITEEYLK